MQGNAKIAWVMAAWGLAACTPAPGPAPQDPPRAEAPAAPVAGLVPRTKGLPVARPLGPELLAFDSDRSGSFEIWLMRADGTSARALTDDASFDSWWPRISPDRRTILFYRTPAGVHDRDYTKTSLWVVASDGSQARELRPRGTDGWGVQGHAEWSPDGRRLVMFGGRRISSQIFVTDALGRSPRAVTDRGGTNIDPSWAPDGETIVFIGCARSICFRSGYEVYTVGASGEGEPRRLTDDSLPDFDPYFSPDGRRLAWLTQTSERRPAGAWNIRIAGSDGSNPRRLTDDENINSKPEWSRRGDFIYFHRLEIGRNAGFSIFRIRPDGSDLRELTRGHPGVNEYPSS